MPKAGGSVFFGSSDAGVVRWDKPLPFPTPLHAQPDLSVGQSWMLWNNIWNTVSSMPASSSLPVLVPAARLTVVACALQNYPDWLPFDGVAANLLYRFTIKL